jgi:hypothetical protein
MHVSGSILATLVILFLVATIVSMIFMIIGFGGRKPSAFGWMAGLLVSIAGIVICVYLLARKVVHKIQEVNTQLTSGMEGTLDSLSRGMEDSRTYVLENNKQVGLLKSYVKDTAINEQFYTYFGFRDYYRFPLRYPYAIHCIDLKDNGFLFNERAVKQFDLSDNGDTDLGIPGIKKLAFDNRFLLIEQQNELPGSGETTPDARKYLLFEFDTEASQPAKDLKQLLDLAHRKGYAGADTLMTIEAYDRLF